jgi:hypothetical protein
LAKVNGSLWNRLDRGLYRGLWERDGLDRRLDRSGLDRNFCRDFCRDGFDRSGLDRRLDRGLDRGRFCF